MVEPAFVVVAAVVVLAAVVGAVVVAAAVVGTVVVGAVVLAAVEATAVVATVIAAAVVAAAVVAADVVGATVAGAVVLVASPQASSKLLRLSSMTSKVEILKTLDNFPLLLLFLFRTFPTGLLPVIPGHHPVLDDCDQQKQGDTGDSRYQDCRKNKIVPKGVFRTLNKDAKPFFGPNILAQDRSPDGIGNGDTDARKNKVQSRREA